MKSKLLTLGMTFLLAVGLSTAVGAADTTTLQEAIDAAESGATIALSGDITEDITIAADDDIILDLAGWKLTNSSGHTITNNGKLTIQDSSEEKDGTVDNVTNDKSAIYNYNSGTITLNGGIFERSAEAGTCSVAGDGTVTTDANGNSSYTLVNEGVMEINAGVTVKNSGGHSSMIHNGWWSGGSESKSATLTINDGTFNGGVNTVKNDEYGILYIKDGDFSNTAQHVILNWNKAYITGGTFSKPEVESTSVLMTGDANEASSVGYLEVGGCTLDGSIALATTSFYTNKGDIVITDEITFTSGGSITLTTGATLTIESDVTIADGATVTIPADSTLTIASDKTLTIADGAILTIADGATLTNEGTIVVNDAAALATAVAAGGTVEIASDISMNETLSPADDTELVLNADLTITATDGDAPGYGYGIYVDSGDLTISGDGNLTITAYNTGIYAGDALSITTTGNIAIDAGANGIEGDTSVEIDGTGTITIDAVGAGINSGSGSIFISSTDAVTITADTGIYTDNGDVTISNDGDVTITATSTTNAIGFEVGGNVTIDGTGDLTITATSTDNSAYGIYADKLTITDVGTMTITANGNYNNYAVLVYALAADADPADYIVLGSDVEITVPTDGELAVVFVSDFYYATVSDDGTTAATSVTFSAIVEEEDTTSSGGNYKPSTSTTTTTTTTTTTSTSDVDTSTNDDDSVTATVEPSTSTSSGVTSASVDEDTMSDAVDAAVDAADGEDIYVEIVVDTKTSTTAVEVEVSAEALEVLVDSGVEALVITSDIATVTIPEDALEEVLDASNGYEITIVVSDASSDLTSDQEAAVGDAPVYDISILCDGDKITAFGGESIVITLPYTLKDGESADTIVVWYIDDDGVITPMYTVYDAETETVSFSTTHLSVYAVINDTNVFEDVDPNAYYYDAVQWAVENGVTGGTTDTTFSPTATCTRAQAVTFLWRAAGEPEATAGAAFSALSDVAEGSYYYDAVVWAIENGITAGTTATTFDPYASCTRGQIVTFLWRMAGEPSVYGEGMSDVASGAYYYSAVNWAIDQGITTGYADGSFGPSALCNRGAIVTFLYRYLG